MSKDNDAFGPLPKKPAAAFHHPIGFELYDALAMDLHAMKYAEQCVKAEREARAITAWSIGMDLHQKQFDARDVGASCASAIRARGDT